MSEKYFNLKKQLELLGYNKHLPPDAVPLVECLTADLLQTTRSLQHYMETAQDALRQRDELVLQAEPYKCDNARLLKENNNLNKLILQMKEEHMKLTRETSRKIKSLQDEIIAKEDAIMKLKMQCKESGLRGVTANTLSFRNKMKHFDNKIISKECNCATRETVSTESKIVELQNVIKELTERSESYRDEILLLQKKVEHRDEEIERLQVLLEGGRPMSAVMKECGDIDLGRKMSTMYKEFRELESENAALQKQLDQSVEKQHEAMLRAVTLADKNKLLEEELSKLDKLALKVEDECNHQIKAKNSENVYLREQVNELLSRNSKLQTELVQRRNDSIEKLENSVSEIQKIKDYLNTALKEKDNFFQQVKTLKSLNESLQEKLTVALAEVNVKRSEANMSNFATKNDLIDMLEKEKQDFVSNSLLVQKRVADALEDFSINFKNAQKDSICFKNNEASHELHKKISEIEQKVVDLERENLQLKSSQKIYIMDDSKDEKISELKAVNAQLKKDNMRLSSSLSFQNQSTSTAEEVQLVKSKNTILKLNDEIERLTSKINMLKNEKKELSVQYKDALNTIESMKRELTKASSHREKLEEENVSYRTVSRSERGSAEHVREECHYLREQILNMQSDLIKEKTLVAQMKTVQSEFDKSNSELQNELLNYKKQLALSNDNCYILECKLKDLQAEVLSLRIEKSKLIDDLQKLDNESHVIAMELDKKNQSLYILEQQNKSKMCTIERLENEISDLKEVNIMNNISEQKIRHYESKIQCLHLENQRLKEYSENSASEMKHLQSNLASINNALKNSKLECEKAQKDADGLRLQLQHYVAEVKRIEDMLSHKEAERADMLENFASLSVEANLLENTKHSLENEAASKSLQLETYKSKIEELEERLINKEQIIESQSARIANYSCKYSKIETELKLITEEKEILEKNIIHLKELIKKLETEKNAMGQGIQSTDSELQLYEVKIKKLMETKYQLETENCQLKANINSLESLLSKSRREVIELKLALQDATSETHILKEQVSKLNERVIKSHDLTVAGSDNSRVTVDEANSESIAQADGTNEMRFEKSPRISSYYPHGSTI